jgi:uncharacterized membrane protein YdfJ with MMPL/SSD domain
LTERLAGWSSQHAWRVVLIWVVAVVLSVGVIAISLGDVLTTDSEVTNDPESERAYAILEEREPPSEDFVNEIVVVRSDTLTIEDPEFREKVEQVDAAIEATGAAPSYERSTRHAVATSSPAIATRRSSPSGWGPMPRTRSRT